MIKLIKSTFYNEYETKKAVAQFILDEDIFSMNKHCKAFEEAFAKKQGRKHGVFVNNGSVANLLLIQSLLNNGELQKGDKVGFSTLTWPTNVMPLIQLGLKPVAIDCELQTLNVSPANLRKHLGSLKGLFLTNVLGFSDDIITIRKMCGENNILLIEDNCESLGSQVKTTMLGNFGLASTFSFFVGHHMSTIEGGMICTDDDELYDHLVMGRAHGWDRNLSTESQLKLRDTRNISDFYAKYTFYDIASNFRPSEINGFIGTIQMQYWDKIVKKRALNFSKFKEAMDSNSNFYHYKLDHMNVISNFAMPVICKTEKLAQEYRRKFEDAEVEIRPVIAGDMTQQPFYKKYVCEADPLPNARLVHANGFYFGNNPEMTDEEVDQLCQLVAG